MNRSRLRRARRRRIKYHILVCVLAAIMIFSGTKLVKYIIASAERKNTNSELALLYESENASAADDEAEPDPKPKERRTEFQKISDTPLNGSRELLERNSDLIGWIKIPGVLSLPVVYRDNTFYLTHDFDGSNNPGGTVFLDKFHPLEESTQYLFLHGHNMYDGTMFAMVTHYRKPEFIKAHRRIIFNTIYETAEYEILGSMCIPESEMTEYAGLCRPKFATEEEFNDFIDKFRSRSMYFTSETIDADTALLALSTCYGDNNRIVALFKRIEE